MMVPEGWKSSTIGNIAQVTSGGTPSKSDPRYWSDGSIPWIRTTEIQNCHLSSLDVQVFITEEGLKNSSAKLFPKGTILLAMIGQGKTRGQVALLNFKATTNQNSAAIILKRGYDPEFYYNFLLSRYKQIRSASNSAGQSNLSGALVKLIKVPVPPLPEQKKIAQILSTWDQAITATERLLENSQQRKKGLMQQLLTGKKRLPGFEGEWDYQRIGHFLSESRIPSDSNDTGKRLTVRLNLKGIEQRKVRGTEAQGSTAHYVRFAGQFIYGKQNIHKAAFGLIPEKFDRYETSQDLPAFDFTADVDNRWFLYFCSQDWFYTDLEKKMTGTGSKRLNPKTFLQVKLPFPSIDEQKAIAEVLKLASHDVDLIKGKLEMLQREKKALMQQLLTGKRRVKVDAEAA